MSHLCGCVTRGGESEASGELRLDGVEWPAEGEQEQRALRWAVVGEKK